MKLTRQEQIAMVAKAAAGDAEAFGKLYAIYAPNVRWAVVRMVPDDDVEDTVQSVFLHIYTRLHCYRGDAEFSTWLHRVAHNYVLGQMRSTKYRGEKNTDSIDATYESSTGEVVNVIEPGYEDRNIESSVVNKELYAAIDKLKPRESAYLHMKLEGYEDQEIAAIVGCSLATVKSVVFQGKEHLRQLFGVQTSGRVRSSRGKRFDAGADIEAQKRKVREMVG
jgi:RNA polymerase sigma-70 factor (ECF subfamily)